jgi:hypothetical protein
MYSLDCHHCRRHYVVDAGSIISSHRTSEGRVAYVRCPADHALVRFVEDERFTRIPRRSAFAAVV